MSDGSSTAPAQPQTHTGTVSSVRKTFGFIKPVGTSRELFFHFEQLQDLQQVDVAVGLEVEYELGTDPKTGRPCACSVRRAPVGSVVRDAVAEEDSLGWVVQWPTGYGAVLTAGQAQPGILRYVDSSCNAPTHLTFTPQDMQQSANTQDTDNPSLPWVLFRLSWRAGHTHNTQQGPRGAKQGYRAVSIRPLDGLQLVSLQGTLAQHRDLLDKLGTVLPR